MKNVLLISALIFTGFVSAQNTMRFSQLNFAQGVNNPSAIAIDGSFMVDMIYRNQWMGFEGAPSTFALNAQYEIEPAMAVGLNVSYDQVGVKYVTSFAGQYSYRLQLGGNRFVGFGAGIGFDNVVNNLAGSTLTEQNDPAFSKSESKVLFNGSFGLIYNAPKFYIGASMPQLFQLTNSGPDRGFQPPRWHYYISSGFYFSNKRGNYTFNPHLQIKGAMNAPLQGDLILRNTFINRFSLIVGYRSENSIIAGFDILLGGYARVGYSFNYDVGKLSTTKGMSNEFYLGLAFPYHNDREARTDRKYIGRRGGFRSDYNHHSRRKHQRRGRRWGRGQRHRN
ncbi:MAG: PorP/SprF family type IX secretion system membrane protein [Crocinitomicaceae bacterium]|nr:PorP/SprF family type IX secretion system membrane protein [Crocinitomicaceae bacterium]